MITFIREDFENKGEFECPGCNEVVEYSPISRDIINSGHHAHIKGTVLFHPICNMLIDSDSWKISDIAEWEKRANLETQAFYTKSENAF